MDEIYTELTNIFREVFDDEVLVLQPQLTAAEIKAWDSLKQVELLIAVQERFGFKLSSREIDELTCVGDLAKVVQRKRAS
jgi:acyl carrier protein